MSEAAFERVPVDAEEPAYPLAEVLLWENESIQWDTPMDELTAGQRVLRAVSILDSQVNNGGITQFFFNRPEMIPHASEGLRAIGAVDAVEAYDRAVGQVLGESTWHELTQRARGDNGIDWGTFSELYQEFDLEWFNDGWFPKREWNGQSTVVVQHRIAHNVHKCLVEYIRSRPNEFIRPLGPGEEDPVFQPYATVERSGLVAPERKVPWSSLMIVFLLATSVAVIIWRWVL